MVCPALAPPAGFLGGMIHFIDCQAQTIGAQGYQALAAPGSTFSLILTGLLTLFVALFGYRMLFGQMPVMRDGVLALVKIGLVLALATGWPAYRALFYDVALNGPAQLASEIGGPAGLPGTDGGLVARLQLADGSLVALAVVGVGTAEIPVGSTADRVAAGVVPPAFPGFDSFALGSARVFFLTGTIAAFGSVRLIAGLLLALGPFFIAFLLFDGTRGLFEGWLRVLAGAALGALGTAIALAVELALLEPRLADLLARRAAGLPVPAAPVELLVITLVFALALLAILYASARVALGFRLPSLARMVPAVVGGERRERETRVGAALVEAGEATADHRRAAAVADA
ncbi:MAG TPA: type IV secretion system protein, partial [Allosphingosinicella sp.]|nr:type IV secretion system protein [Allosphingosinicella sp.]